MLGTEGAREEVRGVRQVPNIRRVGLSDSRVCLRGMTAARGLLGKGAASACELRLGNRPWKRGHTSA